MSDFKFPITFKKYCKKYPDIKSLTILSLSLYQLFKMNSVPNYAAISTSVDLAKIKFDMILSKRVRIFHLKLCRNPIFI